jgi:hypothetical protein
MGLLGVGDAPILGAALRAEIPNRLLDFASPNPPMRPGITPSARVTAALRTYPERFSIMMFSLM